MKTRHELRLKRKLRVRAKIIGTPVRPRLSVFRSHRRLSVQIIDDTRGITLVAKSVIGKSRKEASDLGLLVAKEAQAKKISSVVFDRSGYRFHGVIKALADAARQGGLIF